MRKLKEIIAGRELVAITATQSVMDAAKLMATKRVGAVVVIEDAELNGIITERDILTRVVATGRAPASVTVAEVMTRNPVTITLDKQFSHALVMMAEGGFRHMPVVEDGKVEGVVSIRDALGTEQREMERLQARLEDIAKHIG
jgi:CBS domain-containing protein